MKELQTIGVGAYIVSSQNKVLLTKRSEKDDYMPGEWELPGGGVEYGEDPKEALKREIAEECGLTIELLKPLTVSTFYMPSGDIRYQVFEIIYKCALIEETQEVKLSFEHSEYKFVDLENLDIKLPNYLREILNQIKEVDKDS